MNEGQQDLAAITRLQVIVRGRVQGVGYRNWTYSQARLHKVNGCVRNLPDGGVEVLAEGTKEALQELLIELKVGPKLANITGVEVTWSTQSTSEFTEFSIHKN